jgi:DNA-binding NarL/FixJ family response regulator
MRRSQTHVLLADDEDKVRSALRLLLEQERGLLVVGEAATVEELLIRVASERPNLLLVDWELPRLQAEDVLPALRACCPCMSVIALSGRPEARRAALASGADAFVSKGDPPDRLLAALEACRAGE